MLTHDRDDRRTRFAGVVKIGEAVAKARERQSQLSIQENYRKGQEQRAIQEARYEWTRWVWVALLVLAAAFGIRAYLKRNA